MNPALRFLESDVQPYSLRNRALLIKKDKHIIFVILYGHNKGSPSHVLALRTFNSSSLPEELSPTCFIFDVLHSLASSRLSHFTIFYFLKSPHSGQTVSNLHLSLSCFSFFAQTVFSVEYLFHISDNKI